MVAGLLCRSDAIRPRARRFKNLICSPHVVRPLFAASRAWTNIFLNADFYSQLVYT